MLIPITLLTLGLGILILGGESLVRGASSIAKKMKVPAIVIGLTIVSFGTSAPELIVNIFSAIRGTTDIAIGNVIGSNIANILLILGVSAIIVPLKVQRGTTWKEIPLALLAVGLVFVMVSDISLDGGAENVLTRTDGLALMAFFLVFLYYTYGLSKTEGAQGESVAQYGMPVSIAMIVGGILLLVFGGSILVDNAVILARIAGMSEALIGLTIVAIGTSLPELVTSIMAAIHRHDDIAVGNVVGSNIFNIFWILGLTSTIAPLPVASALRFDILVNIVATMLLFALMFVDDKHRLNRWQGMVFVGCYIGYIVTIVFRG